MKREKKGRQHIPDNYTHTEPQTTVIDTLDDGAGAGVGAGDEKRGLELDKKARTPFKHNITKQNS